MAGYRDCIGIFNTALGKSFNELSEAEKTKVLDTIGKKIDKEKKIVKVAVKKKAVIEESSETAPVEKKASVEKITNESKKDEV